MTIHSLMTLKEKFNRDGYIVKDGLQKIHAGIYNAAYEEFSDSFTQGVNKYIEYLKVCARTMNVQGMFANKSIGNMLNKLGVNTPVICEQPVFHVMAPELRIPDGYYGTAPHQDWPSLQGSLNMITVWIALTDVSQDCFPLEVIPGSHLGGIREGKVNGSVLEIECDDKDFVPIECKRGDVVFMSGFLIHRTGMGTGFRVAVSQRFDDMREKTYADRGFPCAQKRIVDREVKWKPTPEQVKAVYVV